jgi:hypothetical protein
LRRVQIKSNQQFISNLTKHLNPAATSNLALISVNRSIRYDPVKLKCHGAISCCLPLFVNIEL